MSRFRNSMGGHYLQGLFYETTGSDKSSVVYTLKKDDHEGFPSLYKLYMQADDPTEYQFAVSYLDGWDHWKRLTECSWFKEYVSAWREELELRLRSQALLEIREVAKNKTSPSAFPANRYLLEGAWKPAGASKAGRPTKDAIRAEAHRIASEAVSVTDDYNRIMKVN